jgi:hypothetical protein
VRQTTKERRGFVSRSSPPTKEQLRLRWGACKGILPQQAGSLSTAFLISTKAIFSTKRQDHSPYKLVAAHHNLGSYPATPSRLGGKPLRVTNASKAFRRESQVLKLCDALAQFTQAHKGLNSQPNTRIWLEKQISQRERERVGECFFGFGLCKTAGEAPQQP